MNNQIKQVIKEMILNGEIQIEIKTEGAGLNYKKSDISLSVDGKKQSTKHQQSIIYEG